MIWLVRHGQTAFNAEGRMQGQRDSPLTALGRAQALRVGRRLAALRVEHGGDWRVVASPLGRAHDTARIVTDAMGLPEPALDARLQEVGFGSWEGLTRDEIADRHPETRGLHGLFMVCPDGETFDALSGRLSAWLSEVDETDGVHRVVVSHGGSGRVLRGLYAGLPRETLPTLPVPQDAIFRLHGGRIDQIDCEPA
jgi:probable phosphoglycerate mutase